MDFLNGMLFMSAIFSLCIWYDSFRFCSIQLPRSTKLINNSSKHIKPNQMNELSYAEEISNLDNDVQETLNDLVVKWENDEIFDREECIKHVFHLYEDIIDIMENVSLSNREKLKKTADIKENISICRELISKH